MISDKPDRIDRPNWPKRVTVLLSLLMITTVRAALPETVVTLDTRPGATVSFLLAGPDKPRASLILFAGYDGYLNITKDGIQQPSQNFLVRSRRQFVEQGFTVAVLDSPSDNRDLLGLRDTDWHARDIQKVIDHLRGLAIGPVWVVGTSRGTISAANAAARLPKSRGGPDGLVLTASVSERGGQNSGCLCDVDLEKITTPTLFVHHREDGCSVTPFYETRALSKKLRNASVLEFVEFSGGDPAQGRACGPLSAHGFLGIEQQVIKLISDWIRKH